jgi:hypothetical protein
MDGSRSSGRPADIAASRCPRPCGSSGGRDSRRRARSCSSCPASGPWRVVADPASAADRLYEALLEDRSAEARSLIVTLYLNGGGLAWLCDDVIRSALARIGELWEHDAKGVFLEHRATATCARALTELRLLLPPVGDDAPRAIGGAFEGDVYQVPSAMAGSCWPKRDIASTTSARTRRLRR